MAAALACGLPRQGIVAANVEPVCRGKSRSNYAGLFGYFVIVSEFQPDRLNVPLTAVGFSSMVNSAQERAMHLFNCFSRLLRDDSGATAIEYGLIAALIAVAAVVVMGTVGSNLTSVFTTVASDL
jgi:pilus assembly protein Flp/PilA